MTTVLRSGKNVRSVLVALLLTLPLLVVLGAPAQAATPRPRGLSSSSVSTGAVLSWQPVRRATSYAVQVSTTQSFTSLTWATNTVNLKATPDITLPLGKLFWRVQAYGPHGASNWSQASFSRSKQAGPTLVSPDDGVTLEQPEEPPVLRWAPVPGAVKYELEIDGAEHDWVDTTKETTETTSWVVTDPVPDGTYWWRVRAIFANETNTNPSEERSYTIGPLRSVVTHTTGSQMEDVVLSWVPVPGAVSYEVRVSTDNNFPVNAITDQQVVYGTQYSPPTTYNNASYWWQVRARNALGQTEEWPVFPNETGVFQRYWPEKPTLTYPEDGQTVGNEDLWFQWTPVPHASSYAIDVSTDPGFSNSNVFTSCPTTQTTYVPNGNDKASGPSWKQCWPVDGKGTTQWYWRVRAIDGPKNVQGIMSDVHSFTFSHTFPAGDSSTMGPVTGQRLVINGSSAETAHQCTAALADGAICENVTDTPMLDWDSEPGAKFYRIYLSHDAAFTNLVYGSSSNPDTLPGTVNTRWMPTTALPDTQAGEAYYWYVRACNAQSLCGLTPTQASNAFQKKSAPVQLLAPADNATTANEVHFSWTDYLTTNQATTDPATGEHPTQAARQYRIQVSKTPTFSSTIDDRTVDQTTYTAFDRSYPEGVLYWRVEAIDGSTNQLSWSDIRTFTMASPTPTQTAPDEGAVFNAVPPLRWAPLDHAATYDVEVYADGDTTAGTANKIAWGYNLRQTAFNSPGPLPAAAQPYVWRVRRTDLSNNKSAWSGWRHFYISGVAATLSQPGSGAVLPSTRSFFSWKPVSVAASYYLELRNTKANVLQRYATVGLAYAPPSALVAGQWAWRVISRDADGVPLKASAWRKFRVKG